MFMILFVLDDPGKLIDVLEAWEKAGVTGVTILESTGMRRVQHKSFPMRYMPAFYGSSESHETLIAIVNEESLIAACLEAAEAVVGDLSKPNTGIFTTWPLHSVKGYNSQE